MITDREWFDQNYTQTDESIASLAKKLEVSYSCLQKRMRVLGIEPKLRHRGLLASQVKYETGNTPWNKGLRAESSKKVRDSVQASARTRVERGSTKGTNHYAWKGNEVSYTRLHTWVNKYKGKAATCSECGATKNVEWANISHEYKRDLNDFKALCKPCHAKYDLRTHCPHGHEFNSANTYVNPTNGWRQCRICKSGKYK